MNPRRLHRDTRSAKEVSSFDSTGAVFVVSLMGTRIAQFAGMIKVSAELKSNNNLTDRESKEWVKPWATN